MKLTTMMEFSGTTKNTTAFEILDAPAPMKSPHINTKCLISTGLEGKAQAGAEDVDRAVRGRRG